LAWSTRRQGNLFFPLLLLERLNLHVKFREHCRGNDIPDVEASLLSSYRTVISYLNRVGLAARDPFDCPLASRLRPS
jgi:hypothetical protein